MVINFGKNKLDKKLITSVTNTFNYAIEFLKIPTRELEVNIQFVSPLKIKKINRDFRGVNRVTDIISFPFLLQPEKTGMQFIENEITKDKYFMNVNPETNNIVLGDLYVCFSKMKKQAKEFGTGIEREFTYLCLHGLLHLLGYDHIDEKDKIVMREKEDEILNAMRIEN